MDKIDTHDDAIWRVWRDRGWWAQIRDVELEVDE